MQELEHFHSRLFYYSLFGYTLDLHFKESPSKFDYHSFCSFSIRTMLDGTLPCVFVVHLFDELSAIAKESFL